MTGTQRDTICAALCVVAIGGFAYGSGTQYEDWAAVVAFVAFLVVLFGVARRV